MLDSNLVEIYGVETKNLNRAVSRNIDRFPNKFRFQMTQVEFDEYEKTLRFQFGTLKNEKKLAKYKKLKQGLMQNLLTGKIRLLSNVERWLV